MHSEQGENSTPTEWTEGQSLGITLPPGARAVRLRYRIESEPSPTLPVDTGPRDTELEPSKRGRIPRSLRPYPIDGIPSESFPKSEDLVDGRECTIYGISCEIVEFLNVEGYLALAFLKEEDPANRLHLALDSRHGANQIQESKRLLKSLWYAEPGLGIYPFLQTLSEFEFDRKFYAGYRDHVCHQLKVFLLGLYLYFGSSRIRAAMAQEIDWSQDVDREFLRCWRAAAVFHDVGYVLETQDALAEPCIPQDIYQELDEVFHLPLCAYRRHAGLFEQLLAPEERDLQRLAKAERRPPRDLVELEEYEPAKSLLESLDPLVKQTKLGGSNALTQYYRYARSTAPHIPRDRPPFVDHGITSALFLLHLHRYYLEYTALILPFLDNDQTPSPISDKAMRERIRELASELDAAEKPVLHAAAAIALHNVNREIWDHGHARNNAKLTLHTYELSLTRSPLAFLLALVDTLQDWDRPKYCAPPEDKVDSPLQDQDLTIAIQGDAFVLTFKEGGTPPWSSESRYQKVLQRLTAFLNKQDVEDLIKS